MNIKILLYYIYNILKNLIKIIFINLFKNTFLSNYKYKNIILLNLNKKIY